MPKLPKQQKQAFPAYSNREYLDGLKHKTLGEKNLRPELITAVSDAVSKLVESECALIRTKADVRITTAQVAAYKGVTK